MIIIQDTHEKKPWNFAFFNDVEVERGNLQTGDYTIKGYEDIVCLERKRTTGELCRNLGMKARQFELELARMQKFRFKYIVCEFPMDILDEFPKYSGIPQNKLKYLRMSGKFIKHRLYTWAEKYDVEVIHCNNRIHAENITIQIFKQVIDVINSENRP